MVLTRGTAMHVRRVNIRVGEGARERALGVRGASGGGFQQHVWATARQNGGCAW